jgi:hypothetical protein
MGSFLFMFKFLLWIYFYFYLVFEWKELDIAIVKATNHVECPPKERHVRSKFKF